MIGYAAFCKCTRLRLVDLSKCLADGSEDDVEVLILPFTFSDSSVETFLLSNTLTMIPDHMF